MCKMSDIYNSQMTQQDWLDVDMSSRQIINQLLKSMSVTQSVDDTYGLCSYDLLWVKKTGKRVAIEIKDRSFPSTRYGDIFGETIKETCNQRRLDNKEFDQVLICNVYTDNIIAFADLYDPKAKHFQKYCPTTSLVKGGSKEYIYKDCVSLPQTVKIRFTKNKNNYEFKKVKNI